MKPLRILVSWLQARRRHDIPSHRFWDAYLRNGLAEAGHTYVEGDGLDWAEGLANYDDHDGWKQRTWESLLAQVQRWQATEPVDLFLSYLFPRQIDAEAVRQLRDWGIPCVNFFCDNVREFEKAPEVFRNFDLVWITEGHAEPMYREAGIRFFRGPLPCWIAPEHRRWDHPETLGPSFIGSRDAQREALFAEVLRLGGDVNLFGLGWDGAAADSPAEDASAPSWAQRIANQATIVRRHGMRGLWHKLQYRLRPKVDDSLFAAHARGSVSPEEYVRLTQQCQVTLGVNRYPNLNYSFSQPDTFIRLRDIEAPMMGACYLTEYTPGLEDLYDFGTEIEIYRTAEELVDKLGVLTSDAPRRRELRKRGQQRALANHTLGRSIERIAQVIGL